MQAAYTGSSNDTGATQFSFSDFGSLFYVPGDIYPELRTAART